jgi:ATP-dependent HslUV protease, peptidase subunit HslV
MQGSIVVSARHRINHHKIHRFGDAFIGFTGWSLLHNVFEDVMEKYPENLDFQSCEKDNQPVESSQWDCLIASPGGIFEVDSYRTVIEYERFWADGSGVRFALGAMHAVYDSIRDPEAIAHAGLEAACDLDDGSGMPVFTHTVSLKRR